MSPESVAGPEQPGPRPTTARRHRLRRPRRRTVVLTALGAMAIAVAPWLWVRASAAGHDYTVADAPSAPVALVLGAGLTVSGTPTPFLAGRLQVAKELYDAGKVRVILVSGDNRFTTYDEPTSMRNWLVAHGIPDSAIVRDFAGRDTYDSCTRALRIFGVTRALVVSQDYHVPRAVAICRAVGLDADGVGDRSARQFRITWAAGAVREVPAAWKAVGDVLSGRDPVLGAKETSVQDALNAP